MGCLEGVSASAVVCSTDGDGTAASVAAGKVFSTSTGSVTGAATGFGTVVFTGITPGSGTRNRSSTASQA